jgi:hypothetical protein
MALGTPLRVCIAAWAAVFGLGMPTGSRADDIWPVKEKLLSKKGKHSKDISGIACTAGAFPRSCLVIDDDMQAAQFVTVRNGELEAGDTVELIEDKCSASGLRASYVCSWSLR